MWNELDSEQQDAVRAAGREALVSSYQATDSSSTTTSGRSWRPPQGTLQRGPDGETRDESAGLVLTRWTDDDLALLKSVAVEVMEAGWGGDSPSPDQAD